MNSVPRPHTWIHRHSHTQHVPSFLPLLLWLLPGWWGPWPLSHYSIDWNHILSQGRQMLIDKQTPRHVPHMGVDVLVINYITLGQGLPVDDGFYLRSIYHQHCGEKCKYAKEKRSVFVPWVFFDWMELFCPALSLWFRLLCCSRGTIFTCLCFMAHPSSVV